MKVIIWRSAFALVLVAAITGCSQPVGSDVGGVTGAAAVSTLANAEGVSDGAATDSDYELFFLPPLGADPEFDGVFASDLEPVVRITDDEGDVVATFTVEGNGSQRVRTSDDYFIVNFHLRTASVEPGAALTADILVHGELIGSRSMVVVRPGGRRGSVRGEGAAVTGHYDDALRVNAMRTVPIKFRIERTENDVPPVPPAVIGISDESGAEVASNTVSVNWGQVYPETLTYTLELADEADGEVYFRVLDEDLPLAPWLSLDEASGSIVLDSSDETLLERLAVGDTVTEVVRFYTSYNEQRTDDGSGGTTRDSALTVQFEVFRIADE